MCTSIWCSQKCREHLKNHSCCFWNRPKARVTPERSRLMCVSGQTGDQSFVRPWLSPPSYSLSPPSSQLAHSLTLDIFTAFTRRFAQSYPCLATVQCETILSLFFSAWKFNKWNDCCKFSSDIAACQIMTDLSLSLLVLPWPLPGNFMCVMFFFERMSPIRDSCFSLISWTM